MDGENSRFDQDLAQAIFQNISDPERKAQKNFARDKKALLRKMKEEMPSNG